MKLFEQATNSDKLLSRSLPVRECGLKLLEDVLNALDVTSLPVRECGLKQPVVGYALEKVASLPVRECGLKHPGQVLKLPN